MTKEIIYTSLIALAVSIIVTFGFYNFIPFQIEGINSFGDMLGTSITTIASSDTLKNSRTTINDNFTALNTGKIETSTTSLPLITTLSNLASIGTITSGVWNGTKLTVAYGGTGSSTLQTNGVLYGQGTSALKATPQGVDGQVLGVSGGVPTWQATSLDTTADYTWTGANVGIGVVGEIIAYASSTIPSGWLAANGASISTTTYSRLFAVIGYTYGGSGANFTLPDLRGRNIIGYGSTDTTIDGFGETGGATSTVMTEAQMPAHTHTLGIYTNTGGNYPYKNGVNFDSNVSTGSTGGNAPHPNLDPFFILQYLIKY